jgi:hypothetical protein
VRGRAVAWWGGVAAACGAADPSAHEGPSPDHAASDAHHEEAPPGAQHGGALVDLGEIHVEGRLLADAKADGGAVAVWITDAHGAPVPAEALRDPRARVRVGRDVQDLALAASADGSLSAPVGWRWGDEGEVVVTFARDGEGFAAAFAGRAGLGWHDHTPLHGGEVKMIGHTHVELTIEGGRARFFVTDAQRRDVCDGVRGRATWSGAEHPLVAVADGGCGLEAAGAPPVGEPVGVTLEVGGEAVEASFAARP